MYGGVQGLAPARTPPPPRMLSHGVGATPLQRRATCQENCLEIDRTAMMAGVSDVDTPSKHEGALCCCERNGVQWAYHLPSWAPSRTLLCCRKCEERNSGFTLMQRTPTTHRSSACGLCHSSRSALQPTGVLSSGHWGMHALSMEEFKADRCNGSGCPQVPLGPSPTAVAQD